MIMTAHYKRRSISMSASWATSSRPGWARIRTAGRHTPVYLKPNAITINKYAPPAKAITLARRSSRPAMPISSSRGMENMSNVPMPCRARWGYHMNMPLVSSWITMVNDGLFEINNYTGFGREYRREVRHYGRSRTKYPFISHQRAGLPSITAR